MRLCLVSDTAVGLGIKILDAFLSPGVTITRERGGGGDRPSERTDFQRFRHSSDRRFPKQRSPRQ